MTKLPGSAGGGGASPLVTWMLGLDASDAVEGMKAFQAEATEGAERFSAKSKAAFADVAKDAALAASLAKKEWAKARTEAAQTLKTMAGVGIGAGALFGRSMINQGNATSGIGAMSSFYNEQLARQVAGVFAPITIENINRVAEMTHWFQKLTGAQQESIRMMGMFTVTTAGLLYVLPRASSALATMMGASKGVAAGFGLAGVGASIGIGAMASTPEGRQALTDVAKAFEPAVKGLMEVVLAFKPAIAVFSEGVRIFAQGVANTVGGATGAVQDWITRNQPVWMRPGGARQEQGRSELTPRTNGFEMPADTWERLNAAAQIYDQQTAENTARIAEHTAEIIDQLRRGGGVIGRQRLPDVVN